MIKNGKLFPRKSGKRPPDELARILMSIYPNETAEELFKELCGENKKEHIHDTDWKDIDCGFHCGLVGYTV